MKKKEILELIKLNLEIMENEAIASVGVEASRFGSFDYEFPDIEGLEKQFNILKKEIKQAKKIIRKDKALIEEYVCDHPVRLDYPNAYVGYSNCIFCGKRINYDNCNNGNTIYNSVNRNRYCAMFLGSYEDEGIEIKRYELKDVYQIVLSILEDKDDLEEIDLVQEVKKINIEDCKIDERKKTNEYYVLVVGGTNQEKINDSIYISSNFQRDAIDLTYRLSGIPKVKVELFDSERNLDSIKYNRYFSSQNRGMSNIRIRGYHSVQDLEKLIQLEKNVPFDVVIDLSNLRNYKVDNSQIIFDEYDLDLKKYFPNSYIINISLFSSQSFALQRKKGVDKTYGIELLEHSENYYSLEDEEIQRSSLEIIEDNVRKVLLKKQSK